MLESKTITFGPRNGADPAERGAAELVLALHRSATSSEAVRRTILERACTIQAHLTLARADHIGDDADRARLHVVDRETYSPSAGTARCIPAGARRHDRRMHGGLVTEKRPPRAANVELVPRKLLI